jgi:hypothetical protein
MTAPTVTTALELAALYTELAEASTQPGQLERRLAPLCPLDLFAFAEKPSSHLGLRVVLPIGLVSAGQELPELRGLSLERRIAESNVSLILSPKTEAFRDVFVSLAADLVMQAEQKSTEGATAAGAALWDRLMRWQAFLKGLPPEGLGPEAQRGLYGELWVLRSCILPHLSAEDTFSAWTGPLRTSKDFQFVNGALEVKTSTASGDQKIEINGEGQLDNAGLPSLFLAHLSIEATVATGETLVEIVKGIRVAANTFEASQKLEDRLRAVGYFDIHEAKYEAPCYMVRVLNVFHVKEGFPRLTPTALPPGVGNVTYKLTVSACEPFRAPESEIRSLWHSAAQKEAE